MAGGRLAAPPAQEQTSEVGDNFFDPQEIRIDVGDSVRWNGGGLRPHTVTSDDGLFDSGRIRAGDGNGAAAFQH
jgi:plastocyanin